jgi:hypothetical protein
LAAFFVFVTFLRVSGIGLNGKATFEKVLTGTAYRPYIYRQLLPAAANLAAPLLDGPSALRLGRRLETVLGDRFFRARLNGRLYPRQVILILAMMYLSLVGFAVASWAFVRHLGYGFRTRYLVPLALLLASTVFFGFGYMYDFTLLFLFVLGLWCMSGEAWAVYLIAFAVATLNKETALFLVLVFVVHFWKRLAPQKFLALAVAQLGIFALIEGALSYRFRKNPGGQFEWHFPDQLATFQELAAHSPWLLALWAAIIVSIGVLVIRAWARKPAFLRSSLSMLPLLVLLFVFFAYPLEIRDFLEVFPIVAILMLPPPAGGLQGPLSHSA